MPNPWTQFTKTALAVSGLLAVLGLIPYAQYGAEQGWPGGLFPSLWANLALWIGDLHWYLPAAGLAGGVAVAGPEHRFRPRLRDVVLVAAILAALSFALRGYVGPYLFHFASQALLDTANPPQTELATTLRPDHWNHLRWLIAQEPAHPAMAGMLAMVHSTVAFAILSAIMLPLGLMIGNGSRRFPGTSRRRAAWAMAAGTVAVVYAAQIGAWRVAVTAEIWPVPLVYLGFLIVPLVILLTLTWSGAAGWPGDELQRPLTPEPTP
jgi:hypothetical protein